MKGLIIGSGQYINKELLSLDSEDSDYIVAVDGGMDYLLELDIRPDVILGDFDSISSEGFLKVEEAKIETISFPKEKDYTDLELAINYLMEKNIDELVIYGATGTRLDHSLSNIYLLDKLKTNNIRAKIVDRNNTISIVDDSMILRKEAGYYVSILPFKGSWARVSLKGFKYPLDRFKLVLPATVGISNEIVDEEALIEVHEGEIIVFKSKD